MDNLVQRLYDMTEMMVEQLEKADYEELDHFVVERERVISELKEIREQQAPSAHQQKLIRQVLAWDQLIQGRMMKLKSEASSGLRKVKNNRKQQDAYSPTYAMDGVYFDKRK